MREKKKSKTNHMLGRFQRTRLNSKPGLNSVRFNQHLLSPRHCQVKRNGEMMVQ